jgi:hypothetical protein
MEIEHPQVRWTEIIIGNFSAYRYLLILLVKGLIPVAIHDLLIKYLNHVVRDPNLDFATKLVRDAQVTDAVIQFAYAVWKDHLNTQGRPNSLPRFRRALCCSTWKMVSSLTSDSPDW